MRRTHTLVGGLTNIFANATVAGVAFIGVATAFDLATNAIGKTSQAIFDFATNLQGAEIAWTTLLGSQTAAQAQLLALNKTAADTPLSFKSVEEASRRFMAMGLSFQEMNKALNASINAVSSQGTGDVGLSRVALAIGQISNNSKILAQDMNQLTQAGIPAWRLLATAAEKLGLTQGFNIAQTRKLATEGKLTSDVFLKAFYDEYGAASKFQKATEAQNTTLIGSFNTLRDNVLAVGSTGFKPLLEAVTNLSNRAATFSRSASFRDWAQEVAGAMSVVIDSVGQLAGIFADALGGVLSVTRSLGKAIYDALSWLNPFATHSPSLVDQVTQGVAEILAQYGKLAGVGGPLGTAADAVRAFAQAASAGFKEYQDAQDQATADSLAIFGDSVPAAYLEAKAALDTLKDSLLPLSGAISAQEAVVKGWDATVKATQETLTAESDKLATMKAGVDALKTSLDAAKARLEAFANTPIQGMKAAQDRIFAVGQQVLAAQKAISDWKVSPQTAATIAGATAAVHAQEVVVADWQGRVDAATGAVKAQEGALKVAERAQRGYDDAVQSARDAVDAQKAVVDRAKAALDAQTGALDAAQKALTAYANTPIAGTRAFADELFGLDQDIAGVQKRLLDLKLNPALAANVAAASHAVEQQTRVVAGAEAVVRAYDASVNAAKVALDQQNVSLAAAKKVVDDLTGALRETQTTMDKLAGTDLTGTGQFADQLFQLDQQAAALQLQLNNMKLGGAGQLELQGLNDELTKVGVQADNVRLQEKLQLDPLRRQIQQLAKPINELPFDTIINGLKGAKIQQDDLNAQLGIANGQYDAQKVAQDNATKALDTATAAREREQQALDAAKTSLQAMNDALDQLKAQQAPKELADQLVVLQDRAQQVKLAETLQLGPLRKQIQDLVTPMNELPFAAIVKGITDTQTTIATLQGSVALATSEWQKQTAILGGLEGALKSAESASAAHAKVVQEERDKLAGLQDILNLNKQGYDDAKTGLDVLNVALKAAQTPPQGLTDALQHLQDVAENLDLATRLQFEPLKKAIEDLAHPVKELSFDAIVQGIHDAQAEIADLTPKLAAATKALDDQQKVVDAATQAHKDATAAYQVENDKLQTLKQQYSDLTTQIRDWEKALQDVVTAAKTANAGADATGGMAAQPQDLSGLNDQVQEVARLAEVFAKSRERFQAIARDFGNVFNDLGTGLKTGDFTGLLMSIPEVLRDAFGPQAVNNVLIPIGKLIAFLGDLRHFVKDELIPDITLLARTFMRDLQPSFAALGELWEKVLKPAFAGLAGSMGEFQGKTKDNRAEGKSMADTMQALVGIVNGLAMVINIVVTNLVKFTEFVKDHKMAQDALIAVVVAVVAGIVAFNVALALASVVLAPVAVLVAAVVTGFLAFLAVFIALDKPVRDFFGMLKDGIANFVEDTVHWGRAGEDIGKLFDKLGTTVNAWLDGMRFGQWLTDTSNAIDAFIASVPDKFGGMMSAIVTFFANMRDETIGHVKVMWKGITDWFGKLWDDLVGHSIIPEMVNAIIGWFGTLKDRVVDWVQRLATDALAKLTQWASDVGTTIHDLVFVTLPGFFGSALGVVVSAFMAIWQGKNSIMEALSTWIDTVAGPAIHDFIFVTIPGLWTDAWQTVLTGFMAIWNGAGSIMEALGNWITLTAVPAVRTFIFDTVPAKWTEAKKVVLDGFMAIFHQILDAGGTAGGIIEWFQKLKDTIGNWMGEKAGGLAAHIRTFADGIKNAVLAGFVGAVEGIGGMVLAMVNKFIDAVNGALGKGGLVEMVNKVIGAVSSVSELLGGGKFTWNFSWTDIPHQEFKPGGGFQAVGAARGARDFQGGAAIVGEQGRELALANGAMRLLGALGPELVTLPQHAMILPNGMTERLLAAGIPGFAGGLNLGSAGSGARSRDEGPIDAVEAVARGLGIKGNITDRIRAMIANGSLQDILGAGGLGLAERAFRAYTPPVLKGGWKQVGEGLWRTIKGMAETRIFQLFDDFVAELGIGKGGGGGVGLGGNGQWAYPLAGPITQEFGSAKGTDYPGDFHYGLDIGAAVGTPVGAVEAGIVASVINDGAEHLGLHVTLQHTKELLSVYGHLSEAAVTAGEAVTRLQTIGRVGMSGFTTGPHLHLGALLNGEWVNPRDYLDHAAVGKAILEGGPVPPAILDIVGDKRGQLAMLMGSKMEGGWGPNFAAGDGGEAIGPYQIHATQHGISMGAAYNPYSATQFMWGLPVEGTRYWNPYIRAIGTVSPFEWAGNPMLAGMHAAAEAERPEGYPNPPAYLANMTAAFNASRGYVGMQAGGLITEPIAGRGLRTGMAYAFGEHGTFERVTPVGGGGVAGPGGTTIHAPITQHIYNEPDAVRRETRRALRQIALDIRHR